MTGRINPYPLGARREAGGIVFSFASAVADCGIVLYDAVTGEECRRIPFAEQERNGNIYTKRIEGVEPEKITYLFYQGEKLVPDGHGRIFPSRQPFGRQREASGLRAGFLPEYYDWEQDRCPVLPYHETVLYCMHVRGFTRHASSKVKAKGTFAGIQEKLAYLQEIGITTLELQPAYEFLELESPGLPEKAAVGICPAESRVNYWGYKEGFYYAPKAAYAASADPSAELRSLVKALHKNHMELILQFYFPESADRSDIVEILRFWVTEYHIDGFHLLGTELPITLLAADPLLADKKMMYYGFDTGQIFVGDRQPQYPHLAEYNDGFLYDVRRFLKGDENMLNSVLRQMRQLPEKAGVVHYLSNYYGFTLADMVSYDRKHNEANGEDNRDGNDYNCSWNCGEEGTARSRKVRQLRSRQLKNAICFLLLSQGTPLIFMGDEFGNSRKGNNNAWCQDNPIGWLDWGRIEKNRELLEFWKAVVAFRKAHPILHTEKELRMMDSLSCDYPDLSYHGESAWCPQTESYSRSIGIMLCGKYARLADQTEDAFLYLAINMHWEKHALALPRLPKQLKWKRAFSTDAERLLPQAEAAANVCQVAPRSITVYLGVPKLPEKEKQSANREKKGGNNRNGKGMESF